MTLDHNSIPNLYAQHKEEANIKYFTTLDELKK